MSKTGSSRAAGKARFLASALNKYLRTGMRIRGEVQWDCSNAPILDPCAVLGLPTSAKESAGRTTAAFYSDDDSGSAVNIWGQIITDDRTISGGSQIAMLLNPQGTTSVSKVAMIQ